MLRLLTVLIFTLQCVLHAQEPAPALDLNPHRPGEIYVGLHGGVDINNFLESDAYFTFTQSFTVLEARRAFNTRHERLDGILMIRIEEADLVFEAIHLLSEFDVVAYAEQPPVYQLFITPDDLTDDQYNLLIVQAEQAWDITTGIADVKIAIVDDAFRLDHEDLSDAWHVNTGEIPGNGIDDDGNGYIDDELGWDAADMNPDASPPVFDDNQWSHGTHVAGIAGATTNNGTGIASMGFNCSLIPVKCTNASPSITHGYEGVDYALSSGADVINMSWGGDQYTQTGQALMDAANDLGIVCVAAAGNSNVDIPMYPASFDYVISVGATDQQDQKASFSNFGATIDVMAPGVDIMSCVSGAPMNYATQSGTSMAAPLVAGLCGLMRTMVPDMAPTEIEECLESTCDNVDGSNSGYLGQIGSGRVNAFQALLCVSDVYAAFEAETFVCPGGSVQFTDLSYNNPDTWQWSFPGGVPATSVEQNPMVTYNVPGVYDVSLTVANEDGVHSTTIEGYITVANPTATVNGSALLVEGMDAELSIHFTGNPPYSFALTNGQETTTYNGINTNPFYVIIDPGAGGEFNVIDFEADGCEGSAAASGATITVLPSPGAFECFFSGIYGDGNVNTSSCAFVNPLDNAVHAGLNHNGHAGIMRLLPDGTYDWAKGYTGIAPVLALERAPNGDHVCLSHLNNQSYVMFRTDAEGNLLWAKTYSWGNDRYPKMVRSLGDSYIIAGWSTFGGTQDNLVIMKVDADGETVWETFWDHVDDQMSYLQRTNDGGCIATGGLHIFGGNLNFFTLELDTDGNLIAKKEFDSNPVRDDNPALVKTADGGYAIAGQITNGSYLINFVSKVDANWEHEWSYTVEDGNGDHVALGVQEDSEGNLYFLLRQPDQNGVQRPHILKFDDQGTNIWEKVGASLSTARFFYNDFSGSNAFLTCTHMPNGLFGENDAVVIHSDTDFDSCLLEEVPCELTPINWTVTEWPAQTYPSQVTIQDITNQVTQIDLAYSEDIPCNLECSTPCEVESEFVSDDNLDCVNGLHTFTSMTVGADSIQWYIAGEPISTDNTVQFNFSQSGTYQVALVAYLGDCFDLSFIQVDVNVPDYAFSGDVEICQNDSVQIWIDVPSQFPVSWTPTNGLSSPNASHTMASPDQTTIYTVEYTDTNGCTFSQEIEVVVDQDCCVSHIDVDFTERICFGEGVVFTNLSTSNGDANYTWSFPNGTTPVSSFQGFEPPEIFPSSIGQWEFILVLEDACGTTDSTFALPVYGLPPVQAGSDTLLCEGMSIVLGSSALAYHEYHWEPADLLNDPDIAMPTALITESQSFVLTVTSVESGCSTSDTVNVARNIAPNLGGDVLACMGDTLHVELPGIIADQIVWSTGAAGVEITITESGVYTVEIENQCGVQSDTFTVTFDDCDCQAYVPNAFTPNNDGRNETFKPVIGCLFEEYRFTIWNRWGEVVFESNDPDSFWIGNHQSGDHYVEAGVYVWRLSYRSVLRPASGARELTGHVVVIR